MPINSKLVEIQKHYWACDFCNYEAGGRISNGMVGITITHGKCEICNKENVMLIPWVDYNWPKSPKEDIKAKLNRD